MKGYKVSVYNRVRRRWQANVQEVKLWRMEEVRRGEDVGAGGL